MVDVVWAVFVGAGVASILAAFYSLVHTDWPENYSTAKTAIDARSRRHGLQYLLIRAVPVYLASVVAGVTASRAGTHPGWTITAVLLIHLASTNLRALIVLVLGGIRRNGRTPASRWHWLAAYHMCVCVCAAMVGFAAMATLSWWQKLVPEPREFVLALWIGLLVAIFNSLILKATRTDSQPVEDVMHGLRVEVGEEIWSFIGEEAVRHNCSPDLVRAVVLAEVEQRPLWVRRIERLAGGTGRVASYGVAQVQSTRAMGDRESVEVLCQNFSGYFPEWHAGSHVIQSLMEARLERHNSSRTFIERVVQFYHELAPSPRKCCDSLARDYRSVIEVVSMVRVKQEWRVGGTAYLVGKELHYCGVGINGLQLAGKVILDVPPVPGRSAWAVKLPLEIRELVVSGESESGVVERLEVDIMELTW